MQCFLSTQYSTITIGITNPPTTMLFGYKHRNHYNLMPFRYPCGARGGISPHQSFSFIAALIESHEIEWSECNIDQNAFFDKVYQNKAAF